MNSSFDSRKAGILVGVIFVLGIGIYFAQQASEKKSEAGKSALYQVENTYEEELKAIPEKDRAVGTTLDVDAKFPKTVAGLNQMLTAKTAPGRTLYEAGVKLGTLYLDHNQADKAVAAFKHVVADSSSSFQKASANYLLGVSEERSNQFKEASDSYQAGLSANVEGLKGELLLGMVRMSLKLNDKEKAKLYLEKMNKEVPGSHSVEIAADLVKGNAS
jgi:TolA-binding protein